MELNTSGASIVLTAGIPSQLRFDDTPQIAFSGRSNVGKSSMINKLLGRKSLARVSSEPGKTITVNYYSVGKSGGNGLYFVDLPGYGYAKRSDSEKKRWSKLVEGYLSGITSGAVSKRLVIQLIDMRHPPTSDDCMMLDWLSGYGINYCVAATKCDKLNKTQLRENLEALRTHPLISPGASIIPFSSLNGTGVEEVKSVIEAFLDS